MADAADKAAEDQERATALFEQQRRDRIAQSMRGYDPSLPVNCVDCSEIVPPERLEAYPHTRRCVGCAADVERGYRARWPS